MPLAGGQGTPQTLGMVPRVASKGPACAEGQLSNHWRARSCRLGHRGSLKVHEKVSGDPELYKSEVFIHIHRNICTHTLLTIHAYMHFLTVCIHVCVCVYTHVHVFSKENSISFSRFSEWSRMSSQGGKQKKPEKWNLKAMQKTGQVQSPFLYIRLFWIISYFRIPSPLSFERTPDSPFTPTSLCYNVCSKVTCLQAPL